MEIEGDKEGKYEGGYLRKKVRILDDDDEEEAVFSVNS